MMVDTPRGPSLRTESRGTELVSLRRVMLEVVFTVYWSSVARYLVLAGPSLPGSVPLPGSSSSEELFSRREGRTGASSSSLTPRYSDFITLGGWSGGFGYSDGLRGSGGPGENVVMCCLFEYQYWI